MTEAVTESRPALWGDVVCAVAMLSTTYNLLAAARAYRLALAAKAFNPARRRWWPAGGRPGRRYWPAGAREPSGAPPFRRPVPLRPHQAAPVARPEAIPVVTRPAALLGSDLPLPFGVVPSLPVVPRAHVVPPGFSFNLPVALPAVPPAADRGPALADDLPVPVAHVAPPGLSLNLPAALPAVPLAAVRGPALTDDPPVGEIAAASDSDDADDDDDEDELHAEPWCKGCFEEFVSPYVVECPLCDGSTSKLGVCEECRAMACSRCIAQGSRSLQAGDKVQVRGLVAAAELNGKFGTLVGLDKKTDRWGVKIQGGGSKSIKVMNLRFVRAARAS